jgi:cytochrome P450
VKRPPGPSTVATLRRLVATRGSRADALAAIAREYGDVAYVRAGPTGLYLLSHPNLTSSVLVTHDDRFEKIPSERRYSRWVVGDSLFTSEGSLHERQRALIDPILYGEVPRLHADNVVEFATAMAGDWRAGETVDVLERQERMTTVMMVRVLFGEGGSKGEAIARAMLGAIEASDAIPLAATTIPNRLPVPGKKRFRRALAELHRLIDEAAAARNGSGEPPRDVLSLLRGARDRDGKGMGEDQARDEAVSLYRGQKRTASAALSWTWYLLSRHPEAEARFHEEIDSALGDRPPTYDDLARIPYTLMVLREAMRLYPPSWIVARKAVAAHPAGDYEIPEGANLLMSPWIHQRDPRFWSDPLRFDPERFAGGIPDELPACAYFPQGAGPHRCPGMDFLPMACVMVLATIGRRWRLRLAPGHEVTPAATVFLAPKGGMPMVPEQRGAS